MSDFGFLGFSLAALLFLILSLLLITSWRGRLQGGLLVAATFASMLWAALFALQSGYRIVPVGVIWAIEALKNIAWCAFLIGLLLQMARHRGAPTLAYRVMAVGVLLSSVLLVLPDDLTPTLLFVDSRYFGQVLAALIGLLLVEQLYRNTVPEQRWGIKYLCLGLGGMFVFDFYLFSDALLFKRIDADLWYARGGVYAVIVPLLAVSAARNPVWSIDLFVSRRVVLHTGSLLIAGAYMLLMASAGYYIRLYGGEWGPALQVTFLFIAVIMLFALLFSGQVRARAKVFFSKHFFNYRYDYREEWLRLIHLLSDTDSETPLFERVIWALAEIVECAGGVLWLCSTRQGCYLAARRNQPEPTLPVDPGIKSLLGFLERTQWVIDIDEYRQQPERYDGLELPDWLEQIEERWLVVPLIHEQRLLGFVLLTKPRIKIKINWENLDLLKTAGRQAAGYLALYEAASALAEAKQFEGFNRLSAFVVHDLKNLIAQLSLLVKNAEKHRNNPAFIDDAMVTIDNAVGKMSRLMAHLRSGAPAVAARRIDLNRIVAAVINAKRGQRPEPRLESVVDDAWVRADPDRLEAVLGHVIQNAQDATDPEGEIWVKLERVGDELMIEVGDNGCGMDEQFMRERLFRPFDSTKGLTGMGIGAYESREFIQANGGHVAVSSQPGEGTRFRLFLPHAGADERQ